ncbi:MAG: hypothetical protein M1828_003444 [Chrysothrix sp. TS-e1954]|nr:MAG: hypothetical protein M1828_003444 [Chrysothrix sp. TS-e1954]
MPPPTANTPDNAKRGAAGQSSTTNASKSRSPSRQNTSAAGTAGGVSHNRSVRSTTNSPMSARAAVKKPGPSSSKESSNNHDDARAETASTIEDLRSQIRKADETSDEYEKEITVLQSRVDEALEGQSKLEESSQECMQRIEVLQQQNQELVKRHRESQSALENEKRASTREREEAATREEDLNASIQRLRENMAYRGRRRSAERESTISSRTSSPTTSPSVTKPQSPASQQDASTGRGSQMVVQKDKVIEALRLELADAHIKLVEKENAGGGQTQTLEKKLLEAQMSNAKLLEDNESYQVLLSEKTLNGDLAKNGFFDASPSRSDRSMASQTRLHATGTSSLADELEDASDVEHEHKPTKVEAELVAAKDQNKALTLYINKIISRLLANGSFEKLFENGSLTGDNPLSAASGAEKKKAAVAGISVDQDDSNKEPVVPSLLQRAGSLFGNRQRPRPRSYNPAAIGEIDERSDADQNRLTQVSSENASVPTQYLAAPNEDPKLAPSVPLRRSHSGRGGHARGASRSHRRATSEWSAGSNIVSSMYRGQQPGASVAPLSPPGLGLARQTSFTSANPPPLVLEEGKASTTKDGDGSSNLATGLRELALDTGLTGGTINEVDEGGRSRQTGLDGSDPPSSPRAAAAAALEGKTIDNRGSERQTSSGAGAGGWFSGQTAAQKKMQMRPLRLVQEKNEAEEAAQAERKKTNRSSIMTWFSKGQAVQPTSQAPTQAQAPPTAATLKPGSSRANSTDGTSDNRPTSGDGSVA